VSLAETGNLDAALVLADQLRAVVLDAKRAGEAPTTRTRFDRIREDREG
jgi:hypothetical protein